MTPLLEKLDHKGGPVYSVIRLCDGDFLSPVHYHEEYELIFIVQGGGTGLFGQHVQRFKPDDIFFLAPGLPHQFKPDADQSGGECIIIHMDPHFPFRELLKNEDLRSVRQMLNRSVTGVEFLGNARTQAREIVSSLCTRTGIDQLVQLLKLLDILSSTGEFRLISKSSGKLINGSENQESERIITLLSYLYTHFQEPISLTQLSAMMKLSPSALCHYFKKRTKKTVSEFINEVRIGHACKLLSESQLAIKDIALQCGYRNVPYFNRQFKKNMLMSPFQYKRHISGSGD